MNHIIKFIVIAIFLLINQAQAKLFELEAFYLNNGLQVAVIPNHKAPIVKQMIWYKAGSIDEPPGKGGIAHLLEHLMFRGTHKVPDSSFNDIVAKNGGDSNAFTSKDFTVYHEFVDISRLEAVMALEADRMVNLNITPQAFEGERKIVYQERLERYADNPPAKFAEALDRTLWQNTPYSRPVSGTKEEINSLQQEDALSFYQRYYAPNNAILVLAGDIDVATAKIFAQKYFGSLSQEQNSEVSKSGMPTVTGVKENNLLSGQEKQQYRIESQGEKVHAARFLKRFVVPNLQENPSEAYALMVFSKFLGEGDNSFLNRHLTLKGKVAAAGSYYDGLNRLNGNFTVFAVGLPSQGYRETEAILNQSVKNALQHFTQETLEKEKHKMLSGLVYIRDNPEDAAMLVGNMLALGFKPEDIMMYEDNIRRVTLNDVRQAVTKMLEDSSSISGVLRPKEVTRRSLDVPL